MKEDAVRGKVSTIKNKYEATEKQENKQRVEVRKGRGGATVVVMLEAYIESSNPERRDKHHSR